MRQIWTVGTADCEQSLTAGELVVAAYMLGEASVQQRH